MYIYMEYCIFIALNQNVMIKKILLPILLLISSIGFGQQFRDTISYSGLPVSQGNIVEIFDYNGDGREDIIYSSISTSPELYENNGNTTFSNVHIASNLPVFNNTQSIIAFDYDNDSDFDLLVSDNSGNVFFYNNNNGVFSDVTSSLGIINPLTTTFYGLATNVPVYTIPFDYGMDGDLDLLVSRNDGVKKVSVLENNGTSFNSFVDLINISPSIEPINIRCFDYDNDNDMDIIYCNKATTGGISNNGYFSTHPIALYQNNNGLYTDISVSAGFGSNVFARSGASFADYNNDGFYDIVFGSDNHPGGTGPKTFKNNGDGTFTDVTAILGTNALAGFNRYYWAQTQVDFDNDGDVDFYNGASADNTVTSNELWVNNNGVFSEQSSTYGINFTHTAFAAGSGNPYWFDVDNDGDLDVFTRGGNINSALYINNIANNFININLKTCQAVSMGMTAEVTIYVNGILQKDNLRANYGSSHSKSKKIHFGLGSNTIIDSIKVFWSPLDSTVVYNVAVNQTITINNNSLPPLVDLGQDTLSACGAATTLDAGTDPSWASYLWNTTETTQDISVSNSGMYTIAVTDTNGCIGYDTTLVSIIDPTISQIDTNICIGDSLVLGVNDPCQNLVAYFPFNGNSNDESGYLNNGIINGASLTTDRFGNINSAYKFDGVNDYILIPDHPNYNFGNNNFTISYWAYKLDTIHLGPNYNNQGINVWKGGSYSGENEWVLHHSGVGTNFANFIIESGTTYYQLMSNTNLSITRWYNILGTRDNDSLHLYINGIKESSLYVGNIAINDVGDDLMCAALDPSYSSSTFSNVIIDDIRIYNCSLSSSQIFELYSTNNINNFSFSWSTGDTTSSITVQPTTTTTYSVTVDDGISSCTDDVTITVNDPQVTAGADQTICNGDAVTLSGAGASTYTWDNSVTDGVAITPTATADYIVTGTDTLGCVAEDTTTITVNSLPTVDAGIFQQICDGDTVTLSGTGAATYTWDNGLTDGIEFTPSVTTLYTVIGTDANGCIDSDTVSIGVWSLPLVDAGADQTICDEDLVTLSGTGASTYSWDNSVVDGVGFSPSATTTYTLTGTDANGCSDLAYVTVTVNPLPAVDAGAAQIVCTGTPVTLSATGAVSYTWNNGVTDGVAFTPTNTLLYEVTGTDANSCEATDTVTVTVVAELTVLAGTDQTVCEGTSVTLSGSGANTYTWTGGITNAIPFTASSTTIYVVTGSDGNNCADTDSVTVNVNPTPDLSSVTTNVSLGMDGEIDLSVTNGTPPYLYDWDNDGIGDFDDPEDLSTLDAGTYSVIVTDDFGCSDTLMVIITEDLQIFISTVITPNGDGMNDTWGVTGLSSDAKVQVLNRWGQVLYNTTGYSIPWDGTNNGETLPASDYYYIIDLGQGDVRTGTITLKY